MIKVWPLSSVKIEGLLKAIQKINKAIQRENWRMRLKKKKEKKGGGSATFIFYIKRQNVKIVSHNTYLVILNLK